MSYEKRSAPPGPPPPPDAEPEATANPEAHTQTDARTAHCAHGPVKCAPDPKESAARLEAACAATRDDLVAHAVRQVADDELAEMVVNEALKYVRGSVTNGHTFKSVAEAAQTLRDTVGVACAAAICERALVDEEAERYARSLGARDERREHVGAVWLRLHEIAPRGMLARANSADERARWVGGVARMVTRENRRADGRPPHVIDCALEEVDDASYDDEDSAIHEVGVRRALDVVQQEYPALVEFAGLEGPVPVRDRVRACRLRRHARLRLHDEGLPLDEVLGTGRRPPERSGTR